MRAKDLYLILGIGVALLIVIFINFLGEKKVLILEKPSPREKVTLEAGKTYTIEWRSKGIEKVGIVLYKGEEGQWIAQGVPAAKGSFEFKVFEFQPSGTDYRIGIFEFPWKKGNVAAFSGEIEILGPKFVSCDQFSVEREWPFLPSDFPNIKKVFFTKGYYHGDLGGLEGADKICQQEAKSLGYEGEWVAILGDEMQSAAEKLQQKDKINLNSIFVFAEPYQTVVTGKSCHLLLGKTFNDFMEKFSYNIDWLKEKFGEELAQDFANVWLGRVFPEQKKECINEGSEWSYTVSCQNWHTSKDRLELQKEEKLPLCYTREGKPMYSQYLKGLSSSLKEGFLTREFARSCSSPQKLLCVQK